MFSASSVLRRPPPGSGSFVTLCNKSLDRQDGRNMTRGPGFERSRKESVKHVDSASIGVSAKRRFTHDGVRKLRQLGGVPARA